MIAKVPKLDDSYYGEEPMTGKGKVESSSLDEQINTSVVKPTETLQ